MNLLLDTHTLLWLLLEPEKIPPQTLTWLRNTRNKIYVSTASAWEITTKHRLGKLPEAAAVVQAYSSHIDYLQAIELPIKQEHALLAGSHPAPHRDPFDRVLAAQAILEHLTLVSCDAAFQHFPVEVVWQ